LVLKVRIGRHEDAKPIPLSRIEQLTIRELRPAQLIGGYDFVILQRAAQRLGSALVEEHAHLRRSKRAACGMVQYGADLIESHAWKPIHELRSYGAVFEVLEKGRHRHTSAPEYPGAAHPLRVALDSLAR